jgi:biotin synthase-related radical SAM superfamily protein
MKGEYTKKIGDREWKSMDDKEIIEFLESFADSQREQLEEERAISIKLYRKNKELEAELKELKDKYGT